MSDEISHFLQRVVSVLTDRHIFTNEDFLCHLVSEDRNYVFQHHLILPNNQLKTYDTFLIVLEYNIYIITYQDVILG